MASVAVIVPCHNRSTFVRAAIDSIVQQTLGDWELILVDDGSQDDTFDVLANAAARDGRIRAFRRPHEGVGAARNFGASQCVPSTQYLFFLDDDDELEPGALATMSQYLERHPEVGLLGCQFQEITVDHKKVGSATRSRWVPSIFRIPRPLRPGEYETPFVTFYCGTGQGPFAMFRRCVFEKAGGWATEFWPHEDTDLFCKMALISKVHFLPERLYRKRVHGNNVVRDNERMTRAYRAFREKWDNYQPRNETEARIVREAAFFYRTSFKPCRHLRVGVKALLEFLRQPSLARLRWALHLFSSGIRELVQHRILAR
jgi:glycosyltransferase involved in cell wall biosynthesis